MPLILAAIIVPPLVIFILYKLFKFFVKGVEVTVANEKEDREWKAYEATHDVSDPQTPKQDSK
ncbi:MAG: hypothetical protein ACKOAC_01365 [Fluviibacter sp.]